MVVGEEYYQNLSFKNWGQNLGSDNRVLEDGVWKGGPMASIIGPPYPTT